MIVFAKRMHKNMKVKMEHVRNVFWMQKLVNHNPNYLQNMFAIEIAFWIWQAICTEKLWKLTLVSKVCIKEDITKGVEVVQVKKYLQSANLRRDPQFNLMPKPYNWKLHCSHNLNFKIVRDRYKPSTSCAYL